MPLNPQTSPFPPISQPEQGWEHSLRKSLEYLQPGEGIRAGLELGLPLTSGGAVTTGLTPTLASGVIVEGDKVIGPYGPKVTAAAAKNLTNRAPSEKEVEDWVEQAKGLDRVVTH